MRRVAILINMSDTKYRDIADGNFTAEGHPPIVVDVSDTKYRDIADGNGWEVVTPALSAQGQIPSTAI